MADEAKRNAGTVEVSQRRDSVMVVPGTYRQEQPSSPIVGVGKVGYMEIS